MLQDAMVDSNVYHKNKVIVYFKYIEPKFVEILNTRLYPSFYICNNGSVTCVQL
jgi:hypothetical protein